MFTVGPALFGRDAGVCIPDPYYTGTNPHTVLSLHGETTGDSSSNQKPITVLGSVTSSSVQKVFNLRSLAFDGTTGYLTTPNHSDFQFGTGDFSVEAWVYASNLTGTPYIIGKDGQLSTSYPAWVLQFAAGGIITFVIGTAAFSFFALNGIAVNAGQWNYFQVYRKGTTLIMLVNGLLVTAGLCAQNIVNAPAGVLGLSVGAQIDGAAKLTGYIDELRVTLGAARFQPSITPPSGALPSTDLNSGLNSLLLPFSTSTADLSPNTKTATPTGSPPITAGVGVWGSGALSLNGSTQFLTYGTSSDYLFGTGDFTVEYWINSNSAIFGNQGPLCHMDSYNLAGSWCVSLYSISGSTMMNAFQLADTTGVRTPPMTKGAWHHVCFVKYHGIIMAFADGVMGDAYASSYPLTTSNTLRLGNLGWRAETMLGLMNDVRITKGVARYLPSFTPPAAALPDASDPLYANTVLTLHFDGADGGTTFTDSSSYARAPSAVVGATTSTFAVKYGSAAGDFRTNGTSVQYASSTDFDLPGDFTIEFWSFRTVASDGVHGQNVGCRRVYDLSGVGTYRFGPEGFQDLQTTQVVLTCTRIPSNTWVHTAIVRQGNVMMLFTNGTLVSIGTNSTNFTCSQPLWIGRDNDSQSNTSFGGLIDDFRLTKGIARYTANFALPTLPNCDHA